MTQEYQLRILPEIAANEQRLKEYISKEKGINLRNITATRILKRSIDARQRTIFVNLKVRAYINEMPKEDEFERTIYKNVEGKPQVIVVGAGPGGLFAALRLIELGLRPVIVERGKDVRERKKDLAQISREHTVDPESNYSFGEGGAGAYSDGKLYTRSKKRGNIDKILNVFCQHGASAAILADAHPHIGTDKLPRVIENMRNTIIECGGEVHFQTRMDALIIENNEIKGIETNTGKTFLGPVILATGHSARDVYRWLAANGVTIEAKGIAVGVRLEHPAMLIDQIQYHNKNGRGKYLPAAEYSFVTQAEGRGVYSFCMCPGGFIVPAASGPEQVVVNGMSPSNRGSRWSNSGMVVEIQPEDFISGELKMESGELAAQQNAQLLAINPLLSNSQLLTLNTQLTPLHFQEELERQCWLQGGRRQTAPAQRMLDFTRKKLSFDLPESSYSPGLISSPLHFWMPDFISKRLSLGFQQFGRSKLPRVIENMRNTIIECGGEVHFQTRMDALIIENNEIKGIETNTGKTFLGPVILATGHSARDVYRWLAANGVTIEAKGIAVGVRLEHPAMLIDQIQYHNKNGRGKYLPAAEYSFVTQAEGRGVYSFCMCPGGFIVPAASGPEQVVVNGMSPSNRGSRWSNSGMVVEIQPEDFISGELKMESGELAAQQNAQLLAINPLLSNSQLLTLNTQLTPLHFQEELERQCWLQGGRRQTAPAQRMLDFTRKKLSFDLPESSYSPGLISSPLHFWMPDFISKRLSLGFQQFGRSSHGFLTNEAVMIGVETRTSSPVRIVRDKETLQHVTVRGLFPCGEGAGYAGGIVSAGVDGERCAEAVANYINH